ncbi:MAG: Re/Si-specific NAD(P)(+) transhydrogenase subunit alpha [Propionibacteriaceae bacterium]|nr:Re/Si-specific NAD(P)(+) transhydrogenase subunit alpha [Propionibacteriaceae bacterium]
MRIGVPREIRQGETMVAATPKTVTQLIGLGYEVVVEHGAGERAHFPDAAYAAAGAFVEPAEEVWQADVILKVYEPMGEEFHRMRRGQKIISIMAPARNEPLIEQLAQQGVTGLALDAVPRISRAQALDVLSSQANVAGYRAVVEAAHAYGSLLNGQVTAAGKVPPANVFVIGAGVAGLAAIGTAVSLGAIVRATDVRPEVAEQVQSMGGDFVHIDDSAEVSTDGYAKEMSSDQEARAKELYARESAGADIVITTALIPGRPAPTLITREMVADMKPGSVIVDMAAANGGNCELTVKNEKIVTDNGVIILGYTDLAGRLPTQSSQLFGTNVVNLMKLLTPAKDGEVALDMDDVVQRTITVVRDGEIMWPPPPVSVSAAPVPAAASATAPTELVKVDPEVEASRKRRRTIFTGALALVLFGLIGSFGPAALLPTWTVFILAIFVGFYVISNVSHSLHTPLMAETNAISGIIMVGALLQVGSDNLAITIMAFIAILVASINVFGGFLVTRRMLGMFTKG